MCCVSAFFFSLSLSSEGFVNVEREFTLLKKKKAATQIFGWLEKKD
jgi:hypothetical protein